MLGYDRNGIITIAQAILAAVFLFGVVAGTGPVPGGRTVALLGAGVAGIGVIWLAFKRE